MGWMALSADAITATSADTEEELSSAASTDEARLSHAGVLWYVIGDENRIEAEGVADKSEACDTATSATGLSSSFSPSPGGRSGGLGVSLGGLSASASPHPAPQPPTPPHFTVQGNFPCLFPADGPQSWWTNKVISELNVPLPHHCAVMMEFHVLGLTAAAASDVLKTCLNEVMTLFSRFF